jgi:hypothetical protein
MKVAALVLGIFGSLALVAGGALWSAKDEEIAQLDSIIASTEQLAKDASAVGGQTADLTKAVEAAKQAKRKAGIAYPMVGLGLLALVASVLVFKFPRVCGGIMAVAAIIPAAAVPLSLVFGFLLLLAALFAFLVKPKSTATATA